MSEMVEKKAEQTFHGVFPLNNSFLITPNLDRIPDHCERGSKHPTHHNRTKTRWGAMEKQFPLQVYRGNNIENWQPQEVSCLRADVTQVAG